MRLKGVGLWDQVWIFQERPWFGCNQYLLFMKSDEHVCLVAPSCWSASPVPPAPAGTRWDCSLTPVPGMLHRPHPFPDLPLGKAPSWDSLRRALLNFTSANHGSMESPVKEAGCSLPVLDPFDPSIARWTKTLGSRWGVWIMGYFQF